MEIGQRVHVGGYCGGDRKHDDIQCNDQLLLTINDENHGGMKSSTASTNNERSITTICDDDADACTASSTINETKTASISAAELAELLRAKTPIAVLDCRPINAYGKGHCVHAENVLSPPTLLYHRLKGKPNFWSDIRQRLVIPDYNETGQASTIVLIDDDHQEENTSSPGAGRSSGSQRANAAAAQQSFSSYLLTKLRIEGCITYLLEKGAMVQFLVDYPDLCVAEEDADDDDQEDGIHDGGDNNGVYSPTTSLSQRQSPSPPNASPYFLSSLKLKNLNLQDSSCTNGSPGSENTVCYSKDGQPNSNSELDCGGSTTTADTGFKTCNDRDPVNIYATLYLGNAEHARDLDTLRRFNIKYILNVTSDLPNEFENHDKDGNFKYLRIPVVDNVSSNLATYFPMANEFIDQAIDGKVGVLIHCLAGISRSVTFTVAYLMKAKSCGLEDAFDLVKKRKPNIEPNLNFMSQLLAYERTLTRCSDRGSGGMTPDSAVSSLSTSSSSSICADSIMNGNQRHDQHPSTPTG